MIRSLLYPALILAVLADTSSSETHRVRLDGSGDFMVIQDAIDTAASGDTIDIGPGRFETMSLYQNPYWTSEAVAIIQDKELFLIGQGDDRTFIGPDAQVEGNWTPIVIISIRSTLHLRDVTVESLPTGLYSGSGTLDIAECTFRNNPHGAISSHDDASCIIVDSLFKDANSSVNCWRSQNLTFRRCEFLDLYDVAISTILTTLEVDDCNFDTKSGGIQDDSGHTRITNSTIKTIWGYNVAGVWYSDVTLENNDLWDGRVQVASINHSVIRGSNNRFHGATYPEGTKTIYSGLGYFELHECDIAKGTGAYTVWADWRVNLVPVVLHLESNRWGANSEEELQNWIYDQRDDPYNQVIVDYRPALDLPVANRDMTWSELKVLFSDGPEVE